MTRIKLVLEGPTEREFVVHLLAPYVAEASGGAVQLIPTVLITSIAAQTWRGGTGHDYALVKRNVLRAIQEGGADHVSTMLDVYRFPSRNRPWNVTPRPADPLEWVQRLEEAFARDVGDRRFRPYLCLHEFEALLFSSPDAIADQVPALHPHRAAMRSLVAANNSPEHINDGPTTAPAKRLDAWASGRYRKPLDGLAISRAIGVETMRARCRHFDRWVEWLANPA